MRFRAFGLLSFLATVASAQTETQDVIYMKAGGAAFTMDVLEPARPNKAAVVFVVSGGWISDRIHGDNDKIVPLQQAQAMDHALAKAGVEHTLEVVPGGGHDDKTFGPGLMKALQWFKAKLLK